MNTFYSGLYMKNMLLHRILFILYHKNTINHYDSVNMQLWECITVFTPDEFIKTITSEMMQAVFIEKLCSVRL